MRPEHFPAALVSFSVFAKRAIDGLTLHLHYEDDVILHFGPITRRDNYVSAAIKADL
jgi:hypothetical protein